MLTARQMLIFKCIVEEFIENARLVMSVLGRRVFEPIVKKSAKQNNLPVTPVTTNVIFLIKQEIKGDKVNARAIRIVVLSGSKLREKPVRSCPKDAKANRRKYRDLIDENHIYLV